MAYPVFGSMTSLSNIKKSELDLYTDALHSEQNCVRPSIKPSRIAGKCRKIISEAAFLFFMQYAPAFLKYQFNFQFSIFIILQFESFQKIFCENKEA